MNNAIRNFVNAASAIANVPDNVNPNETVTFTCESDTLIIEPVTGVENAGEFDTNTCIHSLAQSNQYTFKVGQVTYITFIQ